jgi:hypothetical protein
MDNQMIDPRYLAMIQAGLGILAGNNGKQPVGATIGQGLLGGVAGYQQNLQAQQEAEMRKQQLDMQNQQFAFKQKEYDREQSQFDLTEGAIRDASKNNPELAPYFRLDPKAAMKAANPQLYANNVDPYFTPIATENGLGSYNNRTGKFEPLNINGTPIVKSTDSPLVRGAVKGAEARAAADYKVNTDIPGLALTDTQATDMARGASGVVIPTKAEQEAEKIVAESTAKSKIDLPRTIAQAEDTVKLVDDLLVSKGFESAVGLSSKLDPRNYIAGTDAKDFNIRLDQLKGKQFLEAFETLKGGGQITEVEGKKATDAISRMNTSATEQEFKKAAREFQDVVRNGLNRAKLKAGGDGNIMPKDEQIPSNTYTSLPKKAPKGQIVRNPKTGERKQFDGLIWKTIK